MLINRFFYDSISVRKSLSPKPFFERIFWIFVKVIHILWSHWSIYFLDFRIKQQFVPTEKLSEPEYLMSRRIGGSILWSTKGTEKF